jgi:hypothetical protein
MVLPINTDELLNGEIIEGERLEFKEGWIYPSVFA